MFGICVVCSVSGKMMRTCTLDCVCVCRWTAWEQGRKRACEWEREREWESPVYSHIDTENLFLSQPTFTDAKLSEFPSECHTTINWLNEWLLQCMYACVCVYECDGIVIFGSLPRIMFQRYRTHKPTPTAITQAAAASVAVSIASLPKIQHILFIFSFIFIRCYN